MPLRVDSNVCSIYDGGMRAEVAAGFAAGPQGNGVVYAAVQFGKRAALLRVAFTVQPLPALLGRQAGYAALIALCSALRARGLREVRFRLEDAEFAAEIREHREVPAALAMAYVRLGCALNQFAGFDVRDAGAESRLTAMARSEVSVHAAA